MMSSVAVELDEELVDILGQLEQPVARAVTEMTVLELYRRGTISSGRAAAILGMRRVDFIKYASELGIPFFDMTDEEWEVERQMINKLWSA
jgi:predicted HTH domain antitoxin